MALLYFGLQRTTWRLMQRSGAHSQYYPLSFLPTILLWAYMGNENVLLAFVVALLGVQLLSLLYHSICTHRHDKWSLPLFLLITIPAAYWLLGAVVWVYVALWHCTSWLPHAITSSAWVPLCWRLQPLAYVPHSCSILITNYLAASTTSVILVLSLGCSG